MVDIWLFIFLKLVKKHKVQLASTASISVLWSTASRGRHSICLQRRLRPLHGLRHALSMHSVCICAYACTHAAMHSCGHAHMRPCTHAAMHTCGHAHMRPCTHAAMHTCGHVHMRPCTHAAMHTCGHVHMRPCTHAAMYTCGHVHMRPCTHAAMYTCTSFTCMQSLLHVFTQSTHLFITSHSDDYATGLVEGFPGAPFLQARMQDLVFDCWIKRHVDLLLITTIDNLLVCKFPYNSTCIHFINEAVTKVIQDFFSCTDREESPCTDIFAHCRT